MTLADRIAEVIVERGPLPVCVIATTVRKQKAEVIAALNGNPGRSSTTVRRREHRAGVSSARCPRSMRPPSSHSTRTGRRSGPRMSSAGSSTRASQRP